MHLSQLLRKIPIGEIWPFMVSVKTHMEYSFWEWWAYFKTRLPFAFKNYKGYLILVSAIITYIELVCSLIYPPDALRKMNVLLLIAPLILAPLAIILWVFICSLYHKGRDSLDGYIGYSLLPPSVRLVSLENELKSTSERLGRIEERLEGMLNRLTERVEYVESTQNRMLEIIGGIEHGETKDKKEDKTGKPKRDNKA